MQNRVVITGLGIVSSLGDDLQNFWQRLLTGNTGIRAFPSDEPWCQGLEIGSSFQFDATKYIEKRGLRYIDRVSRFSIASAINALRDAELRVNETNSERIGIVLGSMFSGFESISEFNRQMYMDDHNRTNPMLLPNLVLNSPVSRTTIELGIKGCCLSLCNGFSSGSDAIGCGLDLIRTGKADVVIAGGAEEITPLLLFHLGKNNFLPNGSRPAPCSVFKPFDTNRKGLLPGEGSAMLVLESYRHAKERKVPIYAEITGYGSYGCLGHKERASGVKAAIEMALNGAANEDRWVDYICCEGNATRDGDVIESQAIRNVFQAAAEIPVSSVKPATGHALGAAGAFNAVVSVLAIKNQIIPPTLNSTDPDPECGLRHVFNKPLQKEINRVLSNAICPRGNSSAIVFSKVDGFEG